MGILSSSSVAAVTSYNGFVFDPDYTTTTQLVVTPVEDPAGRTTMYNEYRIRLRSYITGAPTDAAVVAARQRLTKFGGAFVYGGTSRGVGTISLNTTSRRDVLYGPKPTLLALEPKGPNACRLDWEVMLRVPDCPAARYSFAPMALAYRVEFRIRRNGRTDRAVTGELRIPNNRKLPGSREILDSPDRYRETIPPPVPEGFRREWGPWQIDESRTRLSFGWTDSELDGSAFPPGVVDAKVSQTTRSTGPGMLQWETTIRAEYEALPGYEAVPLLHWARVVKDRIVDAKKRLAAQPGKAPPTFVPVAFECSEPDLFHPGRQAFAVTYRVSGVGVRDILNASGMWRPVPDSDWKQWDYSLKESAHHPRGIARLKWTANEDRIVDLCGDEDGSDPYAPSKFGPSGMPPAVVAPATSWLAYRNDVQVEADSGTTEMRQLPKLELKPTTPGELQSELRGGAGLPPPAVPYTLPAIGQEPARGAADFGGTYGGPPAADDARVRKALDDWNRTAGTTGFDALLAGRTDPRKPEQGATVQQRGGSVVVYMTGFAVRAGVEIPCPELKEVEGETPVPANRRDKGEGFVTGCVGNAGVPIFGARWRLRYTLKRIPTGPIPAPPNPLLGHVPAARTVSRSR